MVNGVEINACLVPLAADSMHVFYILCWIYFLSLFLVSFKMYHHDLLNCCHPLIEQCLHLRSFNFSLSPMVESLQRWGMSFLKESLEAWNQPPVNAICYQIISASVIIFEELHYLCANQVRRGRWENYSQFPSLKHSVRWYNKTEF